MLSLRQQSHGLGNVGGDDIGQRDCGKQISSVGGFIPSAIFNRDMPPHRQEPLAVSVIACT